MNFVASCTSVLLSISCSFDGAEIGILQITYPNDFYHLFSEVIKKLYFDS
jgi:hypothetical protein